MELSKLKVISCKLQGTSRKFFNFQLETFNLKLFIALLSLLWFTACEVENFNYPSSMRQLPTELNLKDAYFFNKDTGYVCAGGIFTTGLVLKTQDGGTTWDTFMNTNTGVNSFSYQNGIFSISESGQNLHSSSNFQNWSFVHANGGWWNWQKHIRLADNSIILVGGENLGRGFLHWKRPNENFISIKDSFEHELMDITVTPNRTLYTVGYGVIMKSTDEGNSWIVSNVTGDFFRGVDFVTDHVGYVVGEYGSVYKTTDSGDSWTQCRGANSVFADPNKLLRDIAFVDEHNGFLVGGGNMVFHTTDGGKVWKKIVNLDGYADFNAIRIFNKKAYLCGNNGLLLVVDLE